MTLLSILPERMLSMPGAIIGTTGSGKTVLTQWLAAQIARAEIPLPFCIIDPMGVSWGLKLSADGQSAGLQVILAGVPHDKTRKPQPDIPITETSGALLAQVMVKNRLSMIVDLSGFEDDEDFGLNPDAKEADQKRQRFAGDFYRALYQANELPMHLFNDEAHSVAPQVLSGPDSQYSRKMLERIAKQGRTQGIRSCFITQRPASLSKDVLMMTDWMVLMRTNSRDLDTIKSYFGTSVSKNEQKQALLTVPKMKPGEAYIDFPQSGYFHRRQFPMIDTFNSSKTPDEKDIGIAIAADMGKLDLGDIAASFEEAKHIVPETLTMEEHEDLVTEAVRVAKRDERQSANEALHIATAKSHDEGYELGLRHGAKRGSDRVSEQIRAVLDGKVVVELTQISGERL